MLSKVEAIRLANFGMLHRGRTVNFNPVVSGLVTRYRNALGANDRTTLIDEATATAVEAAYGLTPGWLSTDHD